MATTKAKRSPAQKERAPKAPAPKAPAPKAKAPYRSRPVQVIARLSVAEKKDLDAMIARWEDAAAAQGFSGKGFADWLRAIIRKDKQTAGQ